MVDWCWSVESQSEWCSRARRAVAGAGSGAVAPASTMLVSPSSIALNSAETAASRQHALSRQSGPREYADGLARWQRVAALAPRELPSRDAPLSRWSSSVRQRSESSVACLAFVYLATTGFYSMCRYEL